MKKYWKEILLASIFIFIILPGIIALSMNIRLICTDTSNEWIGFWGGYLGAIISGFIAIFVMRETIKHENDIRAYNEKSGFCNNIVEIVNNICALINEKNIYLIKFAEQSENDQQDKKDDLYKALLKYNEVTLQFQICETKLISKIKNKQYKNIEYLMDKIDALYKADADIAIQETYSLDELKKIKLNSDLIKPKLGEMRDVLVSFLEDNL